jgi:hypothetical protein
VIIQANKDTLFVFGDNNQRIGYGGQAAVARGEPNTFGLATKWGPGTEAEDYFGDNYASEQVMKRDIMMLAFRAKNYKKIHIINGIGEGRAQLPTRAPKLFAYMISELMQYGYTSEWIEKKT